MWALTRGAYKRKRHHAHAMHEPLKRPAKICDLPISCSFSRTVRAATNRSVELWSALRIFGATRIVDTNPGVDIWCDTDCKLWYIVDDFKEKLLYWARDVAWAFMRISFLRIQQTTLLILWCCFHDVYSGSFWDGSFFQYKLHMCMCIYIYIYMYIYIYIYILVCLEGYL